MQIVEIISSMYGNFGIPNPPSRDIPVKEGYKLGDIIDMFDNNESLWIVNLCDDRLIDKFGVVGSVKLCHGDMYLLSKDIYERNKKIFKSFGTTHCRTEEGNVSVEKVEYIGK